MRKKQINSYLAKFLLSAAVGIISLFIVFLVSFLSLNKVYKKNVEQFQASCNEISDAYAKIISLQVNNYIDGLNSFYLPEFVFYDSKKINSVLKENQYKNTFGFLNVFFIDLEENKEFQKNPFYRSQNISTYDDDIYVSNPVPSVKDGEKNVVILVRVIRNQDEEVKGFLCASIMLETLTTVSNNYKINEKNNIFIIDTGGVFIVHKNKDMLDKTYSPSELKYGGYSTERIATLIDGVVPSTDAQGNPIRIYHRKIQHTGWTFGLVVPISDELALKTAVHNYLYKILSVAFIIVMVLLICESLLFEYFQKKQFIAIQYDPLTNLSTRVQFESEVERMLKHRKNSSFMLVECDIRGFKFINENYGLDAADKLIVFYATKLTQIAHSVHAIIGRGYADRVYIFAKVDSQEKSLEEFKSLMAKFNEEIKSYEIPFYPKFGITYISPSDNIENITVQTLIGQAAFAKSSIKDDVLTEFSIYNSKLLEKINEERYLEDHMEQALKNGEFFIMYQPKMDLNSDRIVGAEALVRWNNPKFGLMLPDSFIPLFEKNGFIRQLDFYVYESVFRFLEHELSNGKPVVPISLNMSRTHSKPDVFMKEFMTVFNKYNVPAKYIQIEILERSYMDNLTLQRITDMLHDEGFSVAMDDFGSGASSLNMLTKIPVDVLKFDRDFLLSSTNKHGQIDSKSAGFIKILVELSKHLEKETIFEGVETKLQRDFLKSINCDQAQGYFYSRPLIKEDFVNFISLHL